MSIVVGIDFDNTIIKYDDIFYYCALQKSLIPKNLKKDKLEIRNFLRQKQKETEWTILQGEVYGVEILRANPFEGMLDALKLLSKQNIPFYIISHKTKYPYLGKKVNLHNAAKKWIKSNGLMSIIDKDRIFFETTIEKKIERIKQCGCTHFIDDLMEVLALLPKNIKKILFNDFEDTKNKKFFDNMDNWSELNDILKG